MKDKSQNPRFFRASMAAALITTLTPMVIALSVFFNGASILNGTPDNAPYRASVMLLFLTPILTIIYFIFWYAISKVLFLYDVLSKISLLSCCVAGSILIGSFFAVNGYNSLGLKDAVFSFIIFTFTTFFSLSMGWIIWCFVGLIEPSKRVQEKSS